VTGSKHQGTIGLLHPRPIACSATIDLKLIVTVATSACLNIQGTETHLWNRHRSQAEIFAGRAEIYRTARSGEIYSDCRWTLWSCESSTRTTLSTVFALPLAATTGSGLLFNFKPINGCDQTSIQALGLWSSIGTLFRERGWAPNQRSVI